LQGRTKFSCDAFKNRANLPLIDHKANYKPPFTLIDKQLPFTPQPVSTEHLLL